MNQQVENLAILVVPNQIKIRQVLINSKASKLEMWSISPKFLVIVLLFLQLTQDKSDAASKGFNRSVLSFPNAEGKEEVSGLRNHRHRPLHCTIKGCQHNEEPPSASKTTDNFKCPHQNTATLTIIRSDDVSVLINTAISFIPSSHHTCKMIVHTDAFISKNPNSKFLDSFIEFLLLFLFGALLVLIFHVRFSIQFSFTP
jgi:hypothetical protein